jgi:hypothetical protein
LPPIQDGRQLYTLDTAGNAKSQEKPVEVSLYGPPGHFELFGDL